ncbi:MAG: hypothetical protein JO359_05115, partial [Candidatus Eremiobacteraeota bacterium]|nr:hypothetical protein [Candidatus Eremiobacteraeota bacterium]
DLSGLVLPDTTNVVILGDEKRSRTDATGTDYLETLSVAAIAPGDATFSPAYVDGVDPSRGNKPFRFSSNALRIHVVGDVATLPLDPWKTYGSIILRATAALALALGLVIGFALVANRFAARRKAFTPVPVARPIPQAPPVQPIDRAAIIRTAAAHLAAERTRENAASLRFALFAYAGARSEETLSALLDRVPEDRSDLRAALRTAERATFVDAANLQGAIEDLLDAVGRMTLK